MALKILSIEIKDSRVNFQKKYEFAEELFVRQSEAVLILQNILNFISIPNRNLIEATTEVQIDSDLIKIYKSYSTNSVKYFINNKEENIDIYKWLSEKLKLTIDPPSWGSRFIDLKNENVQNIDDLNKLFRNKDAILQPSSELLQKKAALTAQFEKLRLESIKGLTQEQVQKSDRLREVKLRIDSIQKEVDAYQSEKTGKEDLDSNIRNKEQELSTINEKLQSVESLKISKQKAVQELQKYNSVSNVQNSSDLKNEKIQKLEQSLYGAFTKPVHKSISDDEADESKLNLKKVLLIIQIPFTLTVLIIFYLLVKQELILLIGFLLIVLEFAYTIFEFQKKPKEDLNLLQPESPQQNQQDDISVNLNQDQILIKQAWRGAYEQELNRIDQLISSNLDGKSYEDMQSEKSKIDNEIAQLKKQQEDLEKNSLDSESYYKKRRELDILKIEKENLEFGSNIQIPNEDQLNNLSLQLDQIDEDIDSIEDIRSSLPFIIINIKDSIKEMLKNLSLRRQIILISSRK